MCSESTAERADALHCIASRLWPGEEGVEPLSHTSGSRTKLDEDSAEDVDRCASGLVDR